MKTRVFYRCGAWFVSWNGRIVHTDWRYEQALKVAFSECSRLRKFILMNAN